MFRRHAQPSNRHAAVRKRGALTAIARLHGGASVPPRFVNTAFTIRGEFVSTRMRI
jgi:hypothetical protein